MSADRIAGVVAALRNDHPLTCPHLTGPEDRKREWLLGYGFAQRLGERDQAKLKVELIDAGLWPTPVLSERHCLKCKHCYIDSGDHGYSEYTPGVDPRQECRKDHWVLLVGQYTRE